MLAGEIVSVSDSATHRALQSPYRPTPTLSDLSRPELETLVTDLYTALNDERSGQAFRRAYLASVRENFEKNPLPINYFTPEYRHPNPLKA
ncbi:MAG: hypothetical protein KGL39_04870 [Patescibacteria group bacterium]|nr:hypothetical protein [Patescibacteria group bacterium]